MKKRVTLKRLDLDLPAAVDMSVVALKRYTLVSSAIFWLDCEVKGGTLVAPLQMRVLRLFKSMLSHEKR